MDGKDIIYVDSPVLNSYEHTNSNNKHISKQNNKTNGDACNHQRSDNKQKKQRSLHNYSYNSNTKRDKMKIQIKKLGNQILHREETVIQTILLKLNRPNWTKYFTLKPSDMKKLGVIAPILILVGVFRISPIVSIILHLLIFILFMSLIMNCNHSIFTNGLKSFVVWYKIIHTLIGSVAEFFIHPFSFPNEHNYKEYGMLGSYLCVTYILNALLFVIIVSLLDGYPKPTVKGLKYVTIISGILYFCWKWCYIYFNFSQSIKYIDKLLIIHVFGHKETFSYKSIALSSISKVIFFLCVQLYRHIKHPNRINTIPTLIKILQTDFDETCTERELELATKSASESTESTESTRANQCSQSNINIEAVSNSSNIYQVTLIKQKTLWYWIFNKALMRSKTQSASWASALLNWRLILLEFVVFMLLLAVKIFGTTMYIVDGTTNLLVTSIIILIVMNVTFNVNKNYFHFKKSSVALVWKEYNFIVMSVAFWINNRQNKMRSFDGIDKTELQGHLISSMDLIGWVIGGMLVSFQQGIFLSPKVANILSCIVVIYFINQGINAYLNQQYDGTITIFSQQVSMRNQIVNRSMDLALWIGFQGYQFWKYPNCFQVTSKFEIEWC